MSITHRIPLDMLEDVADYAGLDPDEAIRTNYSGRGMYGRQCLGLVYDSLSELLGFVAYFANENMDHLDWISGVRQDSMGRSMIAYWPNVGVGEDEA
jgi:hypothetical protein